MTDTQLVLSQFNPSKVPSGLIRTATQISDSIGLAQETVIAILESAENATFITKVERTNKPSVYRFNYERFVITHMLGAQ